MNTALEPYGFVTAYRLRLSFQTINLKLLVLSTAFKRFIYVEYPVPVLKILVARGNLDLVEHRQVEVGRSTHHKGVGHHKGYVLGTLVEISPYK